MTDVVKIKVSDIPEPRYGGDKVRSWVKKQVEAGMPRDTRIEFYRKREDWDFAISNVGEYVDWLKKNKK